MEGEHRKLVRVRAGRVRQRAGARQSFAGPAGIAVATGLSSPRTRSHGPAVRSDDGLHRLAAAAPGSDPRLCGRGRPRRRGQKALQADRLHQLPHSRFGRGSRDLQRFAAAPDGGGARRRWILWRRAAGLEQPDSDGGSTSPSEWRTPPLWGVADSAPYLHDGRAATLAEAIKLHAGQAAPSANRFTGLSDVQQEELIAFLNTLRAPSVLCERPGKVQRAAGSLAPARTAARDGSPGSSVNSGASGRPTLRLTPNGPTSSTRAG